MGIQVLESIKIRVGSTQKSRPLRRWPSVENEFWQHDLGYRLGFIYNI